MTPTFLAGLRKVFREVEQDVLAGMKAMSRAPTWELFDIEKIQAAFAGVGEPFYTRLLIDVGAAEMGRMAVDVAFDVHRPEIAEFVAGWNGKFAKSVTQHTYADLRGTLTAGMDAGENTYQLRQRVSQTMETKTKWEAERIARTESARAVEGGRLEAWRQSGVVKGRKWVASSDACEFCEGLAGMDGMQNLSAPFVEEGGIVNGVAGGEMVADYGPIMHPPAHPNCACTTMEILA